jgi:hypothetical protein
VSKREHRWGIAVALAWALCAPALVHANDVDEDACAQRVFAALDVSRELHEVASAAAASVASGARALPLGDATLLRAIVTAGFDPELLGARARDAFEAHCHDAPARGALAWLERPETRRLLARASETDRSPWLGAHQLASRHRDALLRRIDRQLGRAAREERQARVVLRAMLQAANPMLPPLQRYTAAEIDDLLDWQQRGRGNAEPTSALRARYAGIATRELEAALGFLDGAEGAWLRRRLDAAISETLVRAARATAAELIEVFGTGVPAAPLRLALATS